jgi:DNA replication and repair protein RecF
MIRFSSDFSFVEGVFTGHDGAKPTTVSSGFSRDKKASMKIDGLVQPSFSRWFGHSVVITFGPDDIKLIRGMPRERRSFLDLLLCQVDGSYLENLIAYKHHCQQRNALLSRSFDDIHLDVHEEKMAIHGATIFLGRQEILSFIKPHFTQFYREISSCGENASIEYKPSIECDSTTQNEWQKVFYNRLKESRKKDIMNGFSSIGPHRDDILFFVNGKPAKPFASQGQCTTLTLALRMCSVLCGEHFKKDAMIFLFDDALTYLDEQRTSRVFPLVKDKGQIFLASATDQRTILSDIPRIVVADGRVRRL